MIVAFAVIAWLGCNITCTCPFKVNTTMYAVSLRTDMVDAVVC